MNNAPAPAGRRRTVELRIITDALTKLGPGSRATRIWGRAPGASNETGAAGNVWTADIHDLALHLVTRLYGRPDTSVPASPLAQAEDAKRARDLGGEIGALMDGERALVSAPWYPARHGDVVHVHYEAGGQTPAVGETYLVESHNFLEGCADVEGAEGLFRLRPLTHSLTATAGADAGLGAFSVDACDDPIYDLWFEAGPHRLTIAREGRVVHNGTAPQPRSGAGAAAYLCIGEAERYLERGDIGAALARLRSASPLPPCGSPGFVPEHRPCARPKGHSGACSDNASYVDPPHECPALPEQLHALVTVDAKVEGVHFAGLYAERDAATADAAGFSPWCHREDLTERYVKPAPGFPGEMVLELPKENQITATGVQLAVVVPLQVLPDPRAEDEWAAEGMATALGPEDYAADYDDDYRDDE